MKHTLNKVADSKVEITVEVDTESWKKAQADAFDKLCKEVTVKGFRKGAAPKELAGKHVDTNKMFDEAINSILPIAYSEAVNAEKIRPFFQPKVSVEKISDTELTVKFAVTLTPEVTLGAYKGLHAEKKAVEVTDKEVDDSINSKLAQAAELVVVDREAKKGDTVVIDFDGYVDGKAFDGGKAENYALVLGSNSFVPGFEDALVGVKTGEKKDVNITFPTNYVKELAGKAATFKCVVHEIKEKKVPELNDEAVKDLGIKGVETVEALKTSTKTEIENGKKAQAENAYLDDIIGQIVKAAKATIDDEVITNEAKGMQENLKKRVEQQGLTFEQYLEITGTKIEDLEKRTKEDAEKNIKTFLCLDKIAETEKIAVTDEDVKAEMQKLADAYKMKIEDVEKALGAQLGQFKAQIRERKIIDFIKANND